MVDADPAAPEATAAPAGEATAAPAPEGSSASEPSSPQSADEVDSGWGDALAAPAGPAPLPPAPPRAFSVTAPPRSSPPVGPSVAPTVVTAADFVDEPPPRARPSRLLVALMGAGAATIVLAFALGLLVGRRTARAPLRPATVLAAPAPPGPAVPPAPTPTATTAATQPGPTVPPAAEPEPNLAAAPAATLAPPPTVLATAAPDSASEAQKAAAKAGLAPFNAKAAKTGIANAAGRLKSCKDASMPPGSVSVVITFVPSGRVAAVTVTTPTYAGTRAGACIVSKLKAVQIPPFAGSPETVKKTVAIK